MSGTESALADSPGHLDGGDDLLPAALRAHPPDRLGLERTEVVPIHGRDKAATTLSVLPLIENEPASEASEAGSSSFPWWRRGESNPRPKRPNVEILHAQSGLIFLAAASSGPDDRARQRT